VLDLLVQAYGHEIARDGDWWFGIDDYDFNITSLPKTVGFKIWLQEPYKGLDGVYPDDPTIAKSIDEVTNGTTFGDLTFYPLYNLTMIAGTGGTTNPSPGVHQYPYKTVVSATATAYPWYEFDHWELDSVNVGTANPYSVTMDQNHTLKAVFHPLYALTITTTTGGTTTPAPGMHVYPNGTLVPVSAIASSGYDFDHWELDTVNVGTANPYSVLMTQNHTLNAVFSARAPRSVGGYSVSLAKTPASPPLAYYATALAAFGMVISTIRRRRTGSSKSFRQ
jgi:hypothetical protein